MKFFKAPKICLAIYTLVTPLIHAFDPQIPDIHYELPPYNSSRTTFKDLMYRTIHEEMVDLKVDQCPDFSKADLCDFFQTPEILSSLLTAKDYKNAEIFLILTKNTHLEYQKPLWLVLAESNNFDGALWVIKKESNPIIQLYQRDIYLYFFQALAANHEETIQFLLQNGLSVNATINMQHFDNEPVIHAAIYQYVFADTEKQKQVCLKSIKRLLDLGADLNAYNPWGDKPLDSSISRNHIDIANLLLAYNATFREDDPLNLIEDRLFMALENNYHPDILKLLLKYTTLDINHKYNDGRTIFETAIQGDFNINNIEILFNHLKTIEAPQSQFESLLFQSVEANNLQSIQLLIKSGADVINARNDQHESLLTYALRINNNKEIIEFLQSQGVQETSLLYDLWQFLGRIF